MDGYIEGIIVQLGTFIIKGAKEAIELKTTLTLFWKFTINCILVLMKLDSNEFGVISVCY
jgi:hypothetical protein